MCVCLVVQGVCVCVCVFVNTLYPPTSLSVERVRLRFQSPSSNLTNLVNPSKAFKLQSIRSSCQDYGFEIAGLPASRPPGIWIPGCRLQDSGFQAAGQQFLYYRGSIRPPSAATGRHPPPQAATRWLTSGPEIYENQ